VGPRLAIAGATLGIVSLVGLVAAGPAAAAGTGVTFHQDVFFSPTRSPGWPTGCEPDCSQRVQVEIIDRSGGFKPPVRVFPGQKVDLGNVESMEVTDSYENRGSSFSYFYFVSAPSQSRPVTLTLTQLHTGGYASEFRVEVRCRRWTSDSGSTDVPCR